jgi:hypothetical protein
MSYSIIGFGKVGKALAHAFARRNIEVTVASAIPLDPPVMTATLPCSFPMILLSFSSFRVQRAG